MAYSAGAPPGYSGSPNESTCGESTCHSDTPTQITGWIDTDIPSDGFIADSSYSITVNALHLGALRFGFCLSPQDAFGNLQGELLNDNNTQLRGLGKYITHTSLSINSIDSASWTFNWIAPNPVPDSVIFYCCFNAANGDGQRTGDEIYTCNTIAKPKSVIANYHIPIKPYNDFWFSNTSQTLYVSEPSQLKHIEIYTTSGQLYTHIYNPTTLKLNLPNGTYILLIYDIENQITSLKIAI